MVYGVIKVSDCFNVNYSSDKRSLEKLQKIFNKAKEDNKIDYKDRTYVNNLYVKHNKADDVSKPFISKLYYLISRYISKIQH